ncbi:MAG TPA: NnrU family protein [Allosphingosinicella sp.]
MTDLGWLAVATAAFVGSHLLLSHLFRVRLVGAMGESAFTILYSLIAALTLGWMIFAWNAVNASVPYWIAPRWAWNVASGIMLIASILLAGSLFGNPAFPNPGRQMRAPKEAKGIFAITRHPMNWSFMLWALVHLGLWGSAQNLIVAGGILILAFAGSIGQERKKRALLGPAWREWESRTSFVPFGALLTGRAKWRNAAPGWKAVGIGLAFWLAVTWFHAPTVSPVAVMLGG